MSTRGARYTRREAWACSRAWLARETPSVRSGGFVWYPYSVSQMRFAPKLRDTSRSSRSSVAIVIVSQCPQPPVNGVARAVERIRMMRVGVEPGARRAHAADEVDRGQTPGRAPRGRDASGHLGTGLARWIAA